MRDTQHLDYQNNVPCIMILSPNSNVDRMQKRF